MHCLLIHTSFFFHEFYFSASKKFYVVPFQICLVIPDSITVLVHLRSHPVFFQHAKPIPNKCYVRGTWEFPHVCFCSSSWCLCFLSYLRSFIVCSMLDLNCNSNSPHLGSILLESTLASSGARVPRALGQILQMEGLQTCFSHLAVSQGTARERASPISASPAIQNAAYPGSSYPEGGFLSTQSVKEPAIGFTSTVGFYMHMIYYSLRNKNVQRDK